MKAALERIALSFLRALGGSLIVLAPGVLQAPNLNQAYAVGVAALFASVAAGLKAIQELIPGLSFASLFKNVVLGALVDSFTRASLGAFVVSAIGFLYAPDLTNWKAAVTAILVGAVTAGIRAVQGFATAGEWPAKNIGA